MEDREIIALYLSRSEEAIAESRAQYGTLLRFLIGGILRDVQDIEECENDTYMAAWQSIPPNQPRSLKAYLARIARNTACKRLEYLTAAKRKPEVLLSFDELGESIADGSAGDFTDDTLRETINGFLAHLKPEQRRVFLLRYWQHLSVKEITAQTGYSKPKIETMLSRMRGRLREQLKKEGLYYDKG